MSHARHQNQNVSLKRLGCANARTSGSSGSSARMAFHPAKAARALGLRPAGRALQDGVNQVANGINLRQLRFFDIAAQFLFQAAEQFDALHGVESEIEFQVVGGPHRRRSRVRAILA